MPCGGVYPVRAPGVADDKPTDGQYDCFFCNKTDPTPDHFVDEWDAFLHADCVIPFLTSTEEGKIVIKHRHEIYIVFPNEGGRGY